MSIFAASQPRLKPMPETFPVLVPDSGEVELVVNCFTPQALTEDYHYLQLYYHGGGVYTAVTYVLDQESGLRVAYNGIVQNLCRHHTASGQEEAICLVPNPFGDPIATNLRIQTIGTFALDDDAELVSQLVKEGVVDAVYQGRPIQLIDQRYRANQGVMEANMWHHSTASCVEFITEPNAHFMQSLVDGLVRSYGEDTLGLDRMVQTPHLVKKLIHHLTNMQKQLFIEVIMPCLA